MGASARLLAFVAVLGAGCNLISGVDDLVADVDPAAPGRSPDGGAAGTPDGGGAGTPDGGGTGTPDGGTGTPDGGGSPDSGGTVVFQTGFDTGSECLGWTVTGGTRTADPEGRTAAGSCRVCANGSAGTLVDMAISRPIPAATAGSYTFEAWAKRPASATAPATFHLQVTSSAASITSGRSLSDASWTASSTKLSVGAGDTFTLSVGVQKAAAATCILVDDVVVRVE